METGMENAMEAGVSSAYIGFKELTLSYRDKGTLSCTCIRTTWRSIVLITYLVTVVIT